MRAKENSKPPRNFPLNNPRISFDNEYLANVREEKMGEKLRRKRSDSLARLLDKNPTSEILPYLFIFIFHFTLFLL